MIRSARLRLTVLYTVAVFALAGIVLGGIYVTLVHTLKPAPRFQPATYGVMPDAMSHLPFKRVVILSASGDPESDIKNAERRRTLGQVRLLTLAALGGLFLPSLLIGWIVAGRVLAPIGQITAAARRIQATNLSERIALEGPEDELKTLADTFDEMLGRLDASFAAQRQFVADASHELRNPLAVIQTNADVALQEEHVPDEVQARLRAVRRASDRMRQLVDDLLALARLELSAGPRTEIDLGVVVDEIADELDPLARSHGLRLEASAEGDLNVLADRAAVKRALANLLDNAFRHSPPGAPVRLAAVRSNGWAIVTVADDGPGLSPSEQERVFERFWRSDSARSRESGGTGLGLAIVRRIAESHGGDVAVSSEPGSGSTFELRLPV
jgi:signal transduction histidine kinase